MKDLDIARWRLRTLRLTSPYAASVAEVVGSLLAVQAENPSQSAWAVACRTTTPDPADLAGALASGGIIRTHVLRPTWHYVSAADLGWLIELTGPKVNRTAITKQLHAVHGLDDAGIERASAAVLEALGEGPHLTRDELAGALTERGIEGNGHFLMILLAHLELSGLVASGRPKGTEHTYALLAERVPHSRRLDHDEALAELALRYFTGHGPATERDLAYWATLGLTEVRTGLRQVRDRLESLVHEGRTYWHAPGEPPSAGQRPRAHLLQLLDECYRGYQDSRMVLDEAGIVPRGREVAIGLTLVDAQIAAAMRRTVADASSALTGIIGLVSWELDLWGQLRYGQQAAEASLTSVQADREFARQSIAATTAKAWFIAAQTLGEQQLAADMVGSTEHLVRLAGDRFRVGAGTEQDVAISAANLGGARDSLVQARYAHQSAVRALELLLGRYPATELRARPDLPPLPGPVPAGLPLQMLERRPDMVAAERRVAAAFNRVGQAKAAQLPSISLTGNVGYIASDIVELKQDYNNPSAGVGAKIIAPLYTGGGLEAQVELMSAQQREAVAQYARLALRAIGDVEESLAVSRMLAEREALLKAISADQQRALEHAQTAYRVGRQDLRSVEQQQISLYATRVNLLRVRGEQLSQRVALHLSLGGSFGERMTVSDARP